jgi:hypothetical protein
MEIKYSDHYKSENENNSEVNPGKGFLLHFLFCTQMFFFPGRAKKYRAPANTEIAMIIRAKGSNSPNKLSMSVSSSMNEDTTSA